MPKVSMVALIVVVAACCVLRPHPARDTLDASSSSILGASTSSACEGADPEEKRLRKNQPGVDAFAAAVKAQAGKELAMGKAIVVSLYQPGHVAHLQTVADDHFVVDDPYDLPNMKITWAEGRAIGYFKELLILS